MCQNKVSCEESGNEQSLGNVLGSIAPVHLKDLEPSGPGRSLCSDELEATMKPQQVTPQSCSLTVERVHAEYENKPKFLRRKMESQKLEGLSERGAAVYAISVEILNLVNIINRSSGSYKV